MSYVKKKTKKLATFRPKTFSYLTDNKNENKKNQKEQNSVS